MKVVKLTKKMLKMHPADLLVKLKAVNENGRIGFPQYVYCSKKDYKELKKNLEISIRANYDYLTEETVQNSVGMELLNYGPSQILEEAIKPGYMIIDTDAINVEIVTRKLTT